MVEGIHGNGIIMYDDTSVGEGDRNIPANLPGAVNYASGTTFTVKGGYVVLDGVMYQFAGGVGATTTYTLIPAVQCRRFTYCPYQWQRSTRSCLCLR